MLDNSQKCFAGKSVHSHVSDQKSMYDEIVLKTKIQDDCKAVASLSCVSKHVSQIFNRHSRE